MTQKLNQAAVAADQLLNDYFASRGQAVPASDAVPLTRQIRAKRSWHQPGELAHEAYGIISRGRLDVDDFVENFLRIRVEIQDLRALDVRAGASVFGFADTGQRRIAVCQRTLDYHPLYRSTLSHETGHICLHSDGVPGQYAYAPEAIRRPRVEREADNFMVALLLPWPLVELSVLATALTWRIDIDEPFEAANSHRGRFQWHERFLPDIASRLAVSKHMTLLRLLRRGIISQDTVEYHLRTGSREIFPRATGGPSRLRIDTTAFQARFARAALGLRG